MPSVLNFDADWISKYRNPADDSNSAGPGKPSEIGLGPATVHLTLNPALTRAGSTFTVQSSLFASPVTVAVVANQAKYAVPVTFVKAPDFSADVKLGRPSSPNIEVGDSSSKSVRVVPLKIGIKEHQAIGSTEYELAPGNKPKQLTLTAALNYSAPDRVSASIDCAAFKTRLYVSFIKNEKEKALVAQLANPDENAKPLTFVNLDKCVADGARTTEVKLFPAPSYKFPDQGWITPEAPFPKDAKVKVKVERKARNLAAGALAKLSGEALASEVNVSFVEGAAEAEVEVTLSKVAGAGKLTVKDAAGEVSVASKPFDVVGKLTLKLESVTPKGPYRKGDVVTFKFELSDKFAEDKVVAKLSGKKKDGSAGEAFAVQDVRFVKGEKKLELPVTIADGAVAGEFKATLALEDGSGCELGYFSSASNMEFKVVELPVLLLDTANPIRSVAGKSGKPVKGSSGFELTFTDRATIAVKLEVGEAKGVHQTARALLKCPAFGPKDGPEKTYPVEFGAAGTAEVLVEVSFQQTGEHTIEVVPLDDAAQALCTPGAVSGRQIAVNIAAIAEVAPFAEWEPKTGLYTPFETAKIKVIRKTHDLAALAAGTLTLECASFTSKSRPVTFEAGKAEALIDVIFENAPTRRREVTVVSSKPAYVAATKQIVEVADRIVRFADASPRGPFFKDQEAELKLEILPPFKADTELGELEVGGLFDKVPLKALANEAFIVKKVKFKDPQASTASLIKLKSGVACVVDAAKGNLSLEIVAFPKIRTQLRTPSSLERGDKATLLLTVEGRVPPEGVTFKLECAAFTAPYDVELKATQGEQLVEFAKDAPAGTKLKVTTGVRCQPGEELSITVAANKGRVEFDGEGLEAPGPFVKGDVVEIKVKRELPPAAPAAAGPAPGPAGPPPRPPPVAFLVCTAFKHPGSATPTKVPVHFVGDALTATVSVRFEKTAENAPISVEGADGYKARGPQKTVTVVDGPRTVQFVDELTAVPLMVVPSGAKRELLVRLSHLTNHEIVVEVRSPAFVAPVQAKIHKGKRTGVAKVEFVAGELTSSRILIGTLAGARPTDPAYAVRHPEEAKYQLKVNVQLPRVRFHATTPIVSPPAAVGGFPLFNVGQKAKFKLTLDRAAVGADTKVTLHCEAFKDGDVVAAFPAGATDFESPEIELKASTPTGVTLATAVHCRFDADAPAPVFVVKALPELRFAVPRTPPIAVINEKLDIVVKLNAAAPAGGVRAYIVGAALGVDVKAPVEIAAGATEATVKVTIAKSPGRGPQELRLVAAENTCVVSRVPNELGTERPVFELFVFPARTVSFATSDDSLWPRGAYVPGDKVKCRLDLMPPSQTATSRVAIKGASLSVPEIAFIPLAQLAVTPKKELEVAVQEVYLEFPSRANQPDPHTLTLEAKAECVLGTRKAIPVIVRFPKARFGAIPFTPATGTAPGGKITVHLVLDHPAPFGGAALRLKSPAFVEDVVTTISAGALRKQVHVRLKPDAAGPSARVTLTAEPIFVPALEGPPARGGGAPAEVKRPRCKVDPSTTATMTVLHEAPVLSFEFAAAPGPAFDQNATLVLRVKPSVPPSAPIIAYIKSPAFGAVVHEVRLPKGSAAAVEKEVKFLVGHPEASPKPASVALKLPEGWRPDVAPNKASFPVIVKARPVASVLPCGLPAPLAAPAGGAIVARIVPGPVLAPPVLDELCNLTRLYIVESHGSPTAKPENKADAPARGSDNKGTFEVVADPSVAKNPARALHYNGATPVLQVIAGRTYDPHVDDAGKKFHETWIGLQLSSETKFCDEEITTDGKKHRHPTISVTEETDDGFKPISGGAIEARDHLPEPGSKALPGEMITRFKVEQKKQAWHAVEYPWGMPGLKETTGQQAKNAALDSLPSFRSTTLSDIFQSINMLSMRPRKYRVEVKSHGIEDPDKPFPPAPELKAEIEVFPSDEFGFMWCYESGIDKVRIGRKGTLYDPSQPEAKRFKSVNKGDKSRDKAKIEDGSASGAAADPEFGARRGPGLESLEAPDFVAVDDAPARKYGAPKPTLVFHNMPDIPDEVPDDPYEAGVEIDGKALGAADLDSDVEAEKKTNKNAEVGLGNLGKGHDAVNAATKQYHGKWRKAQNYQLKIQLVRNGKTTPYYDLVTNYLGSLVDTIQALVKVWKGITGDWVPSVGWGMQFNVKFLEGKFKAHWGYKEAKDGKVFKWFSIHTDLTIIELNFIVDFGVKLAILMLKFEAVIYGKITLDVSLDNFGFERTDPDQLPDMKDTWVNSAARAELGVNVVLIHENVIKMNGAVKTGITFKHRANFNLEAKPLAIEYELYWIGLEASATVESKAFKARTVNVSLVEGNPPGLPFRRGVFPNKATQGFWNARAVLTGAWKKADFQLNRIEEVLKTWQTMQLKMVEGSKQSATWKTDPAWTLGANEYETAALVGAKAKRARPVAIDFDAKWDGGDIIVTGKIVGGEETTDTVAAVPGGRGLGSVAFLEITKLSNTGYWSIDDAGPGTEPVELKNAAPAKPQFYFPEGWEGGDILVGGVLGQALVEDRIAAPAGKAAGLVEATKTFDSINRVERTAPSGTAGKEVLIFGSAGPKCHLSIGGGAKYPFTRDLPLAKFKGDDDNAAARKMWTDAKKQWDDQWKQCKRAFYDESSTVERRLTLRTIDLTTRLNEIVGKIETYEAELLARYLRVDAVVTKLKALNDQLDDAEKTAQPGQSAPKAIYEELMKLSSSEDLKWAQAIGDRPIVKMQDEFTDLEYYFKLRKRW